MSSHAIGQEMLIGKKKAAATCNMGYETIGGSGTALGVSESFLFTAGCSGNLTTAYLYHNNSENDNGKLCVYLDDGDGVREASDTLVACSVVIASGASTGWKSNTFGSGTISQGSSYWIAVGYDSGTGWSAKYDAISGGAYTGTSYYDEPADMGSSWTLRSRKHSAYVYIVP